MTLSEAIEHLKEKIFNETNWCEECKNEHIQLLEWLKELKEYRDGKGIS